jgi:hypothetical protein
VASFDVVVAKIVFILLFIPIPIAAIDASKIKSVLRPATDGVNNSTGVLQSSINEAGVLLVRTPALSALWIY